MAYVWVNPVAASMYDSDTLNAFLHHQGFKRYDTSVDWMAIVREKYREAVEKSSNPVVDVRCPKAAEVVREIGDFESLTFPEILPILIHCGQEAYRAEELRDEKKIITTPCKALADLGNALDLENTHFISWNCFLEMLGNAPVGRLPEKSPIPLGFFDSLGLKTISLTGEEQIRKYFEGIQEEEVQLIEMLYCEEGCHNGDGIK